MRLLVVDDVEQIDAERRPRLLRVLAELHDLWDAVIIAGACDLSGVEGWHVVDLWEAAEPAAVGAA